MQSKPPTQSRIRRWITTSRDKLLRAIQWLFAKTPEQQGAVFGLQDLEVSLILILFLFQIVLLMMGVQQNFWGAAICWSGILFFAIRILWKWESTRRVKNFHKVLSSLLIIAGTVYLIRGSMIRTFYLTVRPSFIFLVPTQDLVDCERRAFVVKHVGQRVLSNLEVVLWDDKGSRGDVTKYAEIAPGAPDPLAPKYMWWSPARPWDEEYTVNATAGEMKISQRLIVRSVSGTFQIASEVYVDGKRQFLCRDPLLPSSYTLAADAKNSCESEMALSHDLRRSMELEGLNRQLANGSYVVAKLRTLSATPGIEGQSEGRHIWEYQRTWLINDLSRYAGAKVLLLASGTGAETWKYAEEVRDVLQAAHWRVDGPHKLQPAYDGLLDIQVSRDNDTTDRPELKALMNALTRAGMKHHSRPVRDPDIDQSTIVVWIGSRSPENVNPDDCAGVPYKAGPNTEKPCSAVAQSSRVCPFPPK